MVLCQLLLLSRSSKIYAGLLLVFVHMGLFQSHPCPGSGGSKEADVCSDFPLLVACISLSFAHLKAGTRPGWFLSSPFVRIAPGAGQSPPRDITLICGV